MRGRVFELCSTLAALDVVKHQIHLAALNAQVNANLVQRASGVMELSRELNVVTERLGALSDETQECMVLAASSHASSLVARRMEMSFRATQSVAASLGVVDCEQTMAKHSEAQHVRFLEERRNLQGALRALNESASRDLRVAALRLDYVGVSIRIEATGLDDPTKFANIADSIRSFGEELGALLEVISRECTQLIAAVDTRHEETT